LLEAPPEAEQQLVGRGRIPPFDDAKGTLLGATALVAGTTVGAGVLALPAKTLAAGFLPSSGMLFASWVYMAASGLLIAEVNVNTLCSLERDAVSITSMAAETIGEVGSNVCGVAYVFIHYALLVACALLPGPDTCSRPAPPPAHARPSLRACAHSSTPHHARPTLSPSPSQPDAAQTSCRAAR
tara:strand:- start:297 stop:848 length:552 start_codon:yes stop_codon:yes gene_type:complete